MYKFAHISDCHLGSQKQPELRKLEIAAFNMALDTCLHEKVNFILLSGDLFHVNLPDLGVVREAVRKLKQVHDAGIPVYVVYGSHDYSPNENSIIDVLTDAGMLVKASRASSENGKVRLEFIKDASTGASIVGLSGRKLGLEKHYYEELDRASLEKEKGFKVFIFHAGLDELKPKHLAEMDSMPISLLPKGFDYYAGGHIHKRVQEDFEGYGKVCFAGPLFAGYPRDFEETAKGEKRGFYIVEFDSRLTNIKFVELKLAEFEYQEYDGTGKSAHRIHEELLQLTDGIDPKGKIVILKVKGQISGGKTADINFVEIKERLSGKGAIFVSLNRSQLISQEYSISQVAGEDPRQIETTLLRENVDNVRVLTDKLRGAGGTQLALSLLTILRQDAKLNERKIEYSGRILEGAKEVLELEEIE
jgi:hypothetical protein